MDLHPSGPIRFLRRLQRDEKSAGQPRSCKSLQPGRTCVVRLEALGNGVDTPSLDAISLEAAETQKTRGKNCTRGCKRKGEKSKAHFWNGGQTQRRSADSRTGDPEQRALWECRQVDTIIYDRGPGHPTQGDDQFVEEEQLSAQLALHEQGDDRSDDDSGGEYEEDANDDYDHMLSSEEEDSGANAVPPASSAPVFGAASASPFGGGDAPQMGAGFGALPGCFVPGVSHAPSQGQEGKGLESLERRRLGEGYIFCSLNTLNIFAVSVSQREWFT